MDTTLKTQPHVTVIMPVYNGAKYLRESIESILSQTYPHFELLIINDGSTDASVSIATSYNDPRIRLVHNERNLGLVATRNRGIRESTTEFVAFLDSDDIARPNRLAKQIEYFTQYPETILLGGGAELIDERGVKTGVAWHENSTPDEIRCELLFKNCFTQSTVMMRRSALPPELYREGYAPAEDYDLWVRLASLGATANLPNTLVSYRVHGTNTSALKREDQMRAKKQITLKQLAALGITPTNEEYLLHSTNFAYAGTLTSAEFLSKREQWLLRLVSANTSLKIFPLKTFEKVTAKRFFDSCRTNTNAGHSAWRLFRTSPLSHSLPTDTKTVLQKTVFFLKTFSRASH